MEGTLDEKKAKGTKKNQEEAKATKWKKKLLFLSEKT